MHGGGKFCGKRERQRRRSGAAPDGTHRKHSSRRAAARYGRRRNRARCFDRWKLLVRLPKPIEMPARLSPREQEIVRLVALGYSNKIIGDVLNISSWAVCTHLRRIFAKIGVGSRAAMVARLLGNGVAHATRSDRKTAGEPPDEVTIAPASKRSSALSEIVRGGRRTPKKPRGQRFRTLAACVFVLVWAPLPDGPGS